MTFIDLMSHSSGLNAGLVGKIRSLEAKKKILDDGVDKKILVKKVDGQRSFGGNSESKYLKDEMVALAKYPLGFDPGSEWSYHVSTNMLAYMVEVISGNSLRDYVKETILEPLDMKNTDWYYPSPADISKFVKPYTIIEGKIQAGSTMYAEAAVSNKQTYVEGALGLNGPIEDYAKFCQMLLNKGEFNGHRILKPETVTTMSTFNRLPEKNLGGKGFQFGFELYNELKKPTPAVSNSAYAWGGMLGTDYIIDPKNDLIVLFYINMYKHDPLYPEYLREVYEMIEHQNKK